MQCGHGILQAYGGIHLIHQGPSRPLNMWINRRCWASLFKVLSRWLQDCHSFSCEHYMDLVEDHLERRAAFQNVFVKQHFVQGFWDFCASNPFARKLQGNAKEIFVLHAISVLPKEFLARKALEVCHTNLWMFPLVGPQHPRYPFKLVPFARIFPKWYAECLDSYLSLSRVSWNILQHFASVEVARSCGTRFRKGVHQPCRKVKWSQWPNYDLSGHWLWGTRRSLLQVNPHRVSHLTRAKCWRFQS